MSLLKPDISIPQTMVRISPNTYPLCNTESEAEIYLSMLLHPNFYYLNEYAFDFIDYEKILYIEQTFQNSQSIQEKIKAIKNQIVDNYIYKQKYLYRLTDCLFDPNEIDREHQTGFLELSEEVFVTK